MTKINSIIILLLLLPYLSCFADDSNLENFIYPTHQCSDKPEKPTKPARISPYEDVGDYNITIIEYNIEVATYNKEIKIYKSCINKYIQNGNHDISIIKKELNKALKDARVR